MKQEFSTTIKKHKDSNGAYIEPPFDVYEVFGAKRVKVVATFDGVKYRGSIVKMGDHYMLGITQEIRKEIDKKIGDTVKVTLAKDEEERIVELSPDFLKALDNDKKADEFFNRISYSAKRKFVNWITAAKKKETRDKRISKAIEMLKNEEKLT